MSDEDFVAAGASNPPTHTPGKHRGPRFSWTPAYEATFFRSLCESVRLGLREGSTFKQDAWDRAIQALIDRHNAYAHKTHLINKSDNARKKFRLWRGLREDPEFLYDHTTRTVTASEDAWKRHIEKEPLSRSLKGRPFDHEDFYEVLFPDVIGSRGAPKRLTKPRRKDGTDMDGTDQDASGNSMMDPFADTAYGNGAQNHIPPSHETHIPPPHNMVPTAPMGSSIVPPLQQHPRSASNSMTQRASMSSSALTPPEDPALQHSRKRFQEVTLPSNGVPPQEKRRRTTATGYIDMTQSNINSLGLAPPPTTVPSNIPLPLPPPPQPQQQPQQPQQQQQQHQSQPQSQQSQQSQPQPPQLQQRSTLPPQQIDDVSVLVDAMRAARSRTAWMEQALEVFFREFLDEDMDLQLKIAEKMLTDENKAMVFCKMPEALRKHWVRRLREMHNQRMS